MTAVKYSDDRTGENLLDNKSLDMLIIMCGEDITTTVVNYFKFITKENLLDMTLKQPIAGRTRDVTTTGEYPGSSTKYSREDMTMETRFLRQKIIEFARDIVMTAVKYSNARTGKKLLDNGSLLKLIFRCANDIATTVVNYSESITEKNLLDKRLQQPIVRCTRDVTTTGENPGAASVKGSRGIVTVGDALEELIKVRQQIAECTRDVTTPEEGFGPSVKRSADEDLLQIALNKLGMAEEDITDSHAKFYKKINNPSLSNYEITLLKKKRRQVKNKISQRVRRTQQLESKETIEQEVDPLREKKKELEAEVPSCEKEVNELQRKCNNFRPVPYMPFSALASKVTVRKINDKSVIKSTVRRGGCRPSPYPASSAWRDRNAIITEEDSEPFVKCSGGGMIGKNVPDGTLESGKLITRCAGGVTTTGEGSWPSVERSGETVKVGSLLEVVEAQELPTKARYVITTGEDSEAIAGENLLDAALNKLGMTENQIEDCDMIKLNAKIATSDLLDNEIALVKERCKVRRNNQRSWVSKAKQRVSRSEAKQKIEELEKQNKELKAKVIALKNEIETFKCEVGAAAALCSLKTH